MFTYIYILLCLRIKNYLIVLFFFYTNNDFLLLYSIIIVIVVAPSLFNTYLPYSSPIR